jgi:hypothetical protein
MSAPFFDGCHCAATAGARAASDVSGATRWPEQKGQPDPAFRSAMAARHSCVETVLQRHQTFLPDPDVT